MATLVFENYLANCLTRDTQYIPIFEHLFKPGTHDLINAPLNYQLPPPPGHSLGGMLKYAKGGFIHIPRATINDSIHELFVIFSRELYMFTPPFPLLMLRYTSVKQKSVRFETRISILRQLCLCLDTPIVQKDIEVKDALCKYVTRLANDEYRHRARCRAANIIKKYWAVANVDPQNPVCIRRLEREFDGTSIRRTGERRGP